MKKIIALGLSFALGIHAFAHAGEEEKMTLKDMKQQVFETLPAIFGWCSKEKADNFIDLVLEVKPKVYVEIGVFGGSSLFPVACALKFLGDGVIIGVDPWDKKETTKYLHLKDDAESYRWWDTVNLDRVYYSYLSFIKRFELEDFCITMKTVSEKATAKINSPIDILYLDGNHSENCSKQDVELYLPKVRDGGYIWMNDTLWTTRQDAVDLLLESCDVIKIIDNGNCILFKKR